jgi:flagellar biosynthetic protein FliQ
MQLDDQLIETVRQTLILTLKIATPILASGVVIGLVISIFQSITSIQEQTLTFVPKIIAMILVTVALLAWIVQRLAEFTVEMFSLAPGA